MRPPDVLYMGYSKAGSTFLRGFFQAHPDLFVDRIPARHMLAPESVKFSEEEKIQAENARAYISMHERLCESAIFEAPNVWRQRRWRESHWNDLSGVIDVSPSKIASAWAARFPKSRVLMVIRDQTEWLSSAYRYYVENLALGKRRFVDFCNTPKGMLLLRAGHYDLTIEAYFAQFGEQCVKVLQFEKLAKDRSGFLKELCDFLEIEPISYEAPVANKGRSTKATRILRSLPAWAPVPESIRRAGKHLLPLIPTAPKDILTDQERMLIRGFYAISNVRTEQLLTGRKEF